MTGEGSNLGWVALGSGLIGIGITAVFNYVINIRLRMRDRKANEKRLAYIYLNKITHILAAKTFFREVVLAKIGPFQLKTIGDFDIVHIVCAAIVYAIKSDRIGLGQEVREALAAIPSGEHFFEETFAFNIPDELLIQFPKEATEHYHSFIANVSRLKTVIDIWMNWSKTLNSSLIKAETIYPHYRAFADLMNAAEKLRNVLIESGRVSNKEASALLQKRLEEMKKTYDIRFTDTPKVKNALLLLQQQQQVKNLELSTDVTSA